MLEKDYERLLKNVKGDNNIIITSIKGNTIKYKDSGDKRKNKIINIHSLLVEALKILSTNNRVYIRVKPNEYNIKVNKLSVTSFTWEEAITFAFNSITDTNFIKIQ